MKKGFLGVFGVIWIFQFVILGFWAFAFFGTQQLNASALDEIAYDERLDDVEVGAIISYKLELKNNMAFAERYRVAQLMQPLKGRGVTDSVGSLDSENVVSERVADSQNVVDSEKSQISEFSALENADSESLDSEKLALQANSEVKTSKLQTYASTLGAVHSDMSADEFLASSCVIDVGDYEITDDMAYFVIALLRREKEQVLACLQKRGVVLKDFGYSQNGASVSRSLLEIEPIRIFARLNNRELIIKF